MAHETKDRDPNTPVNERDERNPEAVEGHAPSAEGPVDTSAVDTSTETVDDTARATARDADSDNQVAAPSKEALEDEADVLRGELARVQQDLERAKQEADEMKNKYLRVRADLENYRRRAAQDTERARAAGLDSAVLAVLPVYDDLGRALSVATDDPSQLIPGVKAVREGLLRNLEALGIKPVGAEGDDFNPEHHEALTSQPTDDPNKAGTIAQVFEVGFVKDERLVRPARVVVYQS